MGELEPSVLVVPTAFIDHAVIEPEGLWMEVEYEGLWMQVEYEGLSIEVEYFHEDFDGEFGNRYVTSRGRMTLAVMVRCFSWDIGRKRMSGC
jgi:hypothetical protein